MAKDFFIYNIQNHLASKKFWKKGLVNFSSLLLSAAQCADGVLSAWQAGKKICQLDRLGRGNFSWEKSSTCGRAWPIVGCTVLNGLCFSSSHQVPPLTSHYRWTVIRDAPHVAFWPVFYHSSKKQTTACILCLYWFAALELIGFPVFTLTLLNVLSCSICFHI